MISETLLFLKNQLNAHLKAKAGVVSLDPIADKVVLIDGDRDVITFQSEAVSALLINIEEERALRNADPYTRTVADSSQKIYPDIRLNLYVLFVARFKQYDEGLSYLSSVIGYFQNHRVLDRQNAPALDDRIEKLLVELVTLPFPAQSEIWKALRISYHPSVLYKVKMLVFRDEDATSGAEITDKTMALGELA